MFQSIAHSLILFSLLNLIHCSTNPHNTRFIQWSELKNPIYQHVNWSTKDACMTYNDSTFYVFFSAFFYDEGRERSHVSAVKTEDFKTFSDPLFIWDGKDDGWIGMCSPNITRIGDTYYLTYNSWGDDHSNGMPNQLFLATSKDLENWEKHIPLARNITIDEEGAPRRAIDAAITYANDKFYLVWKAKQTPQIAVSTNITGDSWRTLGRPTEEWFENAEFIDINGKWYLLVTARGPKPERDHLPTLIPMLGDGVEDSDWLGWGEFTFLNIPEESFNTDNRANASFLADWRHRDGYFYLLYAGRTENKSHAGRGDNKLGLARSMDLITWEIP